MNYYEHHLGDWAEETSHLTFLEDAAYSRCVRKYYATERPLPSDHKAVQRLVGARTEEEKAAVLVVLEEFFELQDDGWHNARCDEQLERFREFDVGRQARKESETERKRRTRERRREIFDTLRGYGIVPKWDAPILELEAQLAGLTAGSYPSATCPADVPRDNPGTSATCPADVPRMSRGQVGDLSRGQDADGTASHFPLPNSHMKDADARARAHEVKAKDEGIALGIGMALGIDRTMPKAMVVPISGPSTRPPSEEGAMAIQLRKLGVQVTSQHPTLLGWIRDGIPIDVAVAATDIARISKPWPEAIPANYLDKILRKPRSSASKGPQALRNAAGKSIDELIDEACDAMDASQAAGGES